MVRPGPRARCSSSTRPLSHYLKVSILDTATAALVMIAHATPSRLCQHSYIEICSDVLSVLEVEAGDPIHPIPVDLRINEGRRAKLSPSKSRLGSAELELVPIIESMSDESAHMRAALAFARDTVAASRGRESGGAWSQRWG